jgi:hypothetical protein
MAIYPNFKTGRVLSKKEASSLTRVYTNSMNFNTNSLLRKKKNSKEKKEFNLWQV